MLGSGNEELVGSLLLERLPRFPEGALEQAIARLETHDTAHVRLKCKARSCWLEVNLVRQPDGFLALVQDITERTQTEDLLELKRQVLQSLAEGDDLEMTCGMICHLVEKLVPETLASILELDREEGILRFLAGGPNLPRKLQTALDGLEIGNRAGSCGTAAYLGKPVYAVNTQEDPYWEDFRTVTEEFGIQACWSIPIRAAEGTILGTFAISHFQTATPGHFHLQVLETAAHIAGIAISRHQSELELARHRGDLEELVKVRNRELELSRERLAETERLSFLGFLAAGIAHEINNPLGLIQLLTFQAKRDTRNPESVTEHLDKIEEQVSRCSRIIRNVLKFSRSEPTEKTPSDLDAIVRRSIDFTRALAESQGVAIAARLAGSLPLLPLNPLEIEQVLVNVIRNGIQACQDGGRIRVETRLLPEEVRITVQDDGHGMDPECLKRVFDPFFTTRTSTGGTGLGMSFCHGIIQNHDGAIEIQSEPDQGTEILLRLPLH